MKKPERMLLDVAKSEGLDLGDVDIAKLARGYSKRIRKMEKEGLRIPAGAARTAEILREIGLGDILSEFGFPGFFACCK